MAEQTLDNAGYSAAISRVLRMFLVALTFCPGIEVSVAVAQTVPGIYNPATPAFSPSLPELRYAAIPTARRAAFSGDRFSYMEAGQHDAPVILLLHAQGANSALWRFQYAGLQHRYRVVGWNAPGYMLTDALKAETPSCGDYADAVAAFLESLGVDRTYVVGNSFGSTVAQCFAAAYPDRVRKLVLTGVLIGRGQLSLEDKAKALSARTAAVAAGGMALSLSGLDEVLMGPQTPRALRPMLQSALAATNPRGYMQATRFVLELPPTTGLADRLSMPILMIQGSADRVNPTEADAMQLKAVLRDVRLVTLDGVGHLPEFEASDKVNALLEDFFR